MKNIFFKIFFLLNKNQKIEFILIAFLAVFAGICEIFSIAMVFPFVTLLLDPIKIFNNPNLSFYYQLIGINNTEELIAIVTILFVLGAALSGLTRTLLLHSFSKFAHKIGADLSIRIFSAYLSQPYQNYLSQNTSNLVATVTHYSSQIIYSALYPLLGLLSAIVLILIIVLGAIVTNPVITILALLIFGVIYGAIIIVSKKRLNNHGKIIANNQEKVIKVTQESFGGIRDILLDHSQDAFIKIYADSEKEVRKMQAQVMALAGSPRFILEAIFLIFISGLSFIAIKLKIDMLLILPIIAMIGLAAQKLLPLVQQIYQSLTNLSAGKYSVEKALDVLIHPPQKNYLINCEIIKFDSSIKFENITFSYYGSKKIILSNINFEINKGERVAIIGHSGAGKSTLMDILLGLLSPNSGKIYIDSTEQILFQNYSWQKLVAHVPQNIFLADATILENIAFGLTREQIDFDRAVEAARLASLDDLINSWSEKYETNVGERGSKLSGGQKQRIGIARALYKQASIIILDEPTSSLDAETELAVLESINKLSKSITLIIVTHRDSALGYCEKVFRIDNTGNLSHN